MIHSIKLDLFFRDIVITLHADLSNTKYLKELTFLELSDVLLEGIQEAIDTQYEMCHLLFSERGLSRGEVIDFLEKEIGEIILICDNNVWHKKRIEELFRGMFPFS